MTAPLYISTAMDNMRMPPTCENTTNYTAEDMCALKGAKWLNWYQADLVYANGTVIAFCSFLAVFALLHRGYQYRARYRGFAPPQTTLEVRCLALTRWLAIKQVVIPGWSSVSLGSCLIIASLGIFFALMTLAPGTYYWPELGWAHSPPIATRTGWMGLAILPFLIVMASKQNPLGHLTGISHERLQVFHRWSAFFMLILGLIHTFAFIRYNAQTGTSILQWKTNSCYWTGVGMLVPQLYLTLGSLAPFRNRQYEFFKQSHRLVAILFVVFFFLHCGNILTSWNFFYATVAVYGSAVAHRLATTAKNKWRLRGADARLRVVAPDLLEIRVPTAGGLTWKAGQHFFFRFTSLTWFDSMQSHPFTAITCPSSNTERSSNDIVALAKVHRGEVLHLANIAAWQDGLMTGIWLDGPYGSDLSTLQNYGTILFLGGGSGLTYVISAASEIVQSPGQRDIHLIASCRDETQLQAYLSHMQDEGVTVSSHITGQRDVEQLEKTPICCSSPMSTPSLDGDEALACRKPQEATRKHGRPDLARIISQRADAAKDGKLAVVACGPASFMAAVQSEVARMQLDILSGRSRVRDVYLRSEAFSW